MTSCALTETVVLGASRHPYLFVNCKHWYEIRLQMVSTWVQYTYGGSSCSVL